MALPRLHDCVFLSFADLAVDFILIDYVRSVSRLLIVVLTFALQLLISIIPVFQAVPG